MLNQYSTITFTIDITATSRMYINLPAANLTIQKLRQQVKQRCHFKDNNFEINMGICGIENMESEDRFCTIDSTKTLVHVLEKYGQYRSLHYSLNIIASKHDPIVIDLDEYQEPTVIDLDEYEDPVSSWEPYGAAETTQSKEIVQEQPRETDNQLAANSLESNHTVLPLAAESSETSQHIDTKTSVGRKKRKLMSNTPKFIDNEQDQEDEAQQAYHNMAKKMRKTMAQQFTLVAGFCVQSVS